MERTKEIELRLEKATPGPWTYATYSKKFFGLGHPGSTPHFMLQCRDDTTSSPYAIADASLIAAAPEDLRYLLDRVKSLEGLLQEVRSDEMFSNDCCEIDGKDCRCDMCKDIDVLLAPPATERSNNEHPA